MRVLVAWMVVLVALAGMLAFAHGASDPDIVVEWFPNDDYPNPNRGGKSVYITGLVGPYEAKEASLKAVLWLEEGVDCESVEDPYYQGEKVLHIFLDGKTSGWCPGFKYAHFDAPGGFCSPEVYRNRIEWHVRFPLMQNHKYKNTQLHLWWLGTKMPKHEEVGESTAIGLLSWHVPAERKATEPIFIHCRNDFH